ncbi:MAG: prepilin-type N-terminal cleavage/methylation domain-containing protein, partial [Phycisphaerae bacterium]|nr:prepilin-type N-terminal cleavage/methylation domain-containing protein [Phycisphaerae bacterium]
MKKNPKAFRQKYVYIEMAKFKRQSNLFCSTLRTQHHCTNKYKAFTLLEMVVVVSIIALLLLFLLPALEKTKNNAWKLVCARNLSQISLAMSAYAADFKGVIIKANDGFFVRSQQEMDSLWNILLLPYISKEIIPNEFFENTSKVWFCPIDPDPYPMGFLNCPHPGITSYALNGYYENREGGEIKLGPAGGYQLSQIQQPSD